MMMLIIVVLRLLLYYSYFRAPSPSHIDYIFILKYQYNWRCLRMLHCHQGAKGSYIINSVSLIAGMRDRQSLTANAASVFCQTDFYAGFDILSN